MEGFHGIECSQMFDFLSTMDGDGNIYLAIKFAFKAMNYVDFEDENALDCFDWKKGDEINESTYHSENDFEHERSYLDFQANVLVSFIFHRLD